MVKDTVLTVGNNLFFAGYDSTNGYALWKSDGTTAVMVRDINDRFKYFEFF